MAKPTLSSLLLVIVLACSSFVAVVAQSQIPVEMLPFFTAVSVPGLQSDLNQATYDAVRQGVEDFVDFVYRGFFSGLQRRNAVSYSSVSLDLEVSQYNGGIPESQFNIYAQFGGTTIFSSRRRLQRQRALQTVPTAEQLWDIILGSNLTLLVTDFLDEIEGLSDDLNAYILGLVEDLEFVTESNAPSIMPSAVPSSMPSALPSIMPSAVPSSMPSTKPSPEPTSAPSPDPCPCQRLQLLCRLLNRCLFGFQ